MKFYGFPKKLCPMCNKKSVSCHINLEYPCTPSEMICSHVGLFDSVDESNDIMLSICAEYDIVCPKEVYLKEENFYTKKGEQKCSFTPEQKEFFLKLKDIID